MAKAKGKKKTVRDHHFMMISILSVVLLVLVASFVVALNKQSHSLATYQLLEKIDNQACRYLDNQKAVNGSFDLNMNAPAGQPRLTYTCLTGQRTTGRAIQGKYNEAYNLGAGVAYFATNQEAEKFAEKKINPLRYWGVSDEGQHNDIRQTNRFTFIVTDEKIPYFDAYTVKGNAVLRVSLTCDNPDMNSDACYKQADAILQRELKGIDVR